MVVYALTQRGDLAQAVEHNEELIRVSQDTNELRLLSWGLSEQGRVQGRVGHWAEACAALERSAELADAVPDHDTSAADRGLLGQLYLRQGELEQALEALRESERLCAEHNVWTFNATPFRNGLADAYLLAAERSDGAERAASLTKAKRACRAALKHGKAFRGGLPEAMRLQGTYQWLRGKPAAARKWWGRSIDLAEELGQRYDLGMTHLERGRRLGDRAHLERAEAIFADIGAEWDLAQAREALRKTE